MCIHLDLEAFERIKSCVGVSQPKEANPLDPILKIKTWNSARLNGELY